MAGAGVFSEPLDVAPLLRSAIGALSTFDDAALEELLSQTEIAYASLRRIRAANTGEVVLLQESFGDLLASTSRSLGTLQRLRLNREDAWVR